MSRLFVDDEKLPFLNENVLILQGFPRGFVRIWKILFQSTFDFELVRYACSVVYVWRRIVHALMNSNIRALVGTC